MLNLFNMDINNEQQSLLPHAMSERLTPSTRRHFASAAIFTSVFFERIAYYSFSANLMILLTSSPLCWPTKKATITVILFMALTYTSGLFGGWASDSYLVPRKTIIIGYFMYFLGYLFFIILTFSITNQHAVPGVSCQSWNDSTSPAYCSSSVDDQVTCGVTLYIFTFIIAISSGVVRINMAAFGGDQAQSGGSIVTQRFFTVYYWCMNFASLFAFVGIAVLQEVNLFVGYSVAGASLVVSLIAFFTGWKVYIRIPAGEQSVLTFIFSVIRNAYHVKNCHRLRSEGYKFLDYANMANEGGKFNVNQIDDVRKLWRICKVFLLMVPYWICYSQMFSVGFLLQGLRMRTAFAEPPVCQLKVHKSDGMWCGPNTGEVVPDVSQKSKVTIPAASLGVCNSIFIVVTLLFIERVYQHFASRNWRVTACSRFSFGMLLAAAALTAGSIVEKLRRDDIQWHGETWHQIGNTFYSTAPCVSIYWQIPQYCLLGASEVFLVVTGLEYAYMEAPRNMQGFAMGLFYVCSGLGYFIGATFPYIFWRSNDYGDINCTHLHIVFFYLAVGLSLFTIMFILIALYAELGLLIVLVTNKSGERTQLAPSFPPTPQSQRRERFGSTIQELSSDDDTNS